jgi:hypothetical protein
MRSLMAAALIAATMLVSTPAQAATVDSPPDYLFPRGLPYAPNEGECYTYRCVWDAKHQGNGEGQSMILTRWKGGFIAMPITHRRAHRLQAAYCERRNVTCEGYDD